MYVCMYVCMYVGKKTYPGCPAHSDFASFAEVNGGDPLYEVRNTYPPSSWKERLHLPPRSVGVPLEWKDCEGAGAGAGADPVLRGDGLLPGPGLPATRHIRVSALPQAGDSNGIHEQILQTSLVSQTHSTSTLIHN